MVLPSPGDWAVGCCLLLCCSRGDPKAALDELTLEFNSWMNVGDAEPKGAVTWAPGTQHLHSDSHGKKAAGVLGREFLVIRVVPHWALTAHKNAPATKAEIPSSASGSLGSASLHKGSSSETIS